MKRLIYYIFAVLLACMVWSCADDAPEGLLSESTMEDIIYDYHLAQGITMSQPSAESSKNQLAYRYAILRKYGVTEAQFDSSMFYYCRHTERMQEMYKNVSERIQSEVVASGGDVAMTLEGGVMGDTTDIWNKDRAFIMSPIAPFNLESFCIEADTSFHKGDKFILDFNCQFIYEEGRHDIFGILALTLANDSVVSTVIHYSYEGRARYTISDADNIGIKNVKGFIMVNGVDREAMYKSTHLVAVSDVHLTRMRTEEKPNTEQAAPDSVTNARKDSVDNHTNTNDEPYGHEENPVIVPDDGNRPVRTRQH